MLRIAVPNKGTLAAPAAADAARGRLPPAHRPTRTWSAATPTNDVEFFYLRPRDIATYVGSGDLDLGITGRDLLIDSGVAGRGAARPRLRRRHLPLRRPARHARPRSTRPRRARGSPPRTRAWSSGYLAEHGHQGRR